MSEAEKPFDWEEILGVYKPHTCNLRAACCSVSTPSVPVDELMKMAADGDEFSRDFLSVFLPHANHQAARDFYPEQPDHIDRVLEMVSGQNTKVKMDPESVVFYHCQYLGENRLCQVYEDRPAFCRKYPSSPLNILVKGCGYEGWVASCKAKLLSLGYEVSGG